MKTTVPLFSIFLLLVLGCSEHKTSTEELKEDPSLEVKNAIPSLVIDAFNKKYENASNLKWEQESDGEWEVDYTLNGEQYSSNFDTNGLWLETEKAIKVADIPAVVQSVITANFPDFKIHEAELIESNTSIWYEFDIKSQEIDREISISLAGELLENEIIDEEKDDDEHGDDDDN